MLARRQGWILVVASTASFQPVPFLSTYAATKGFDRYFALGLAEELAPHGVRVTVLCPGPTESEFFEVAEAEQFRARGVQTAEAVATQGIDALARSQRTVIPYFGGRLSALLVRLVPTRVITWIVARAARPKDD
jgi:short-subunit dehydrogenase